MRRILVTGGAGYVGSVLVRHLLQRSYNVTVVDNLLYDNGYTMISCFEDPNFVFVKGDVRDESVMRVLVAKHDVVIHLAAIVGFPACEKNQDLASSVNLQATHLLSQLVAPSQLVIYASTGSNYGHVDGLCTEESPLRPLSLYGRTKTAAERCLLENNTTVAYRFATAFGLSPRMRLDLLINDFVYEAVINQYLIMFEKHFKRTFIHVNDMAQSFLFALEHAEQMKNQVYNVGDSSNNHSKEDIALMLKEYVNYYLHFADVGEDKDKRNYEVSFDKIQRLGFRCHVGVRDGIKQLISALPVLEHRSRFRNI